jgi:hypothetical protein
MSYLKTSLASLILLTSVGDEVFSQVKKSVRSTRYDIPRVSKSKAIILCPTFEESKYPYQAIGFKVGDPLAITYKFYPNKKWAFALDAGKTASGLYNKYYRGVFESLKETAIVDELTKDPLIDTAGNQQLASYLTHNASGDWFLEGKILYQWDAGKISKGLQLYAGVGWQLRDAILNFEYLYENGDQANPTYEAKIGSISENRFTFGPVALLGFEYSYFTLPISAFIEVEMFTDVYIDPGHQRFQGGVGLRYVF